MTQASSWYSDPDLVVAELRRGLRARQDRDATPRIAGYDDVRELGRGGQGLVFTARQRSTRRTVAIKVLLDGAFATAAARRRFEREIELVATLEHPGMVRIFDSGTTDDGRLYYVMEHIDGVPLDAWMRQCPGTATATAAPPAPPTRPQRLHLLAAIADAVHYAHQRGVIHRDLKPGNILVDAAGRPHVLDFGLAKPAGDDAVGLAVSISGQFLGSVPWASPEQAAGSAAVIDIRTDVYALGVILYQLLTGEFPYDVSGSLSQVLENIKGVQPRRPSMVAAGIDDELDTITLQALAKDPARRYQSAGDLAADLRRYLRGDPIDAKRDSPWYLIRKTARRHRAALAVTTLLGLTIMAGVAATVWQWRHAERQRARAEQRFNDVRQLAHAFMFDVHDRIAELAGSRPARELLVQTSLRYLQSLAAENAGDESLAVELAGGHQRVGDILGHPATTNLGDSSGALAEYHRALDLLEPFAASTRPETRRIAATIRNRLGDVLSSRGDRAAAMDQFQRALDTFTALAAQAPQGMDHRHVGATQLRIGDVLGWTNDQAGAMRRFQAAIEVFEALLDRDHPDPRDQFNLQICLSKAGFTSHMLGDDAEALRLHRRALAMSQALADADPTNAARQRSVEINHNQVGAMLANQGDLDGAMRHFQAALALARTLADADPDNRLSHADLAYTHNKIGETHWAAERTEQALGHFEQALRIRIDLAAADPDHGNLLRDLATSYLKVGDTSLNLAQRGDRPVDRRRSHAAIGRDHFARGLEVLTTMRDRRMLSELDAAMPEQARDGLSQCAALLDALAPGG